MSKIVLKNKIKSMKNSKWSVSDKNTFFGILNSVNTKGVSQAITKKERSNELVNERG